MSRAVPSGAGTANITKTFIAASHDRKSLPTQVHVRPSNINCNSIRADFSLTKFNPAVLIGYSPTCRVPRRVVRKSCTVSVMRTAACCDAKSRPRSKVADETRMTLCCGGGMAGTGTSKERLTRSTR
jgi:hypothetical protein